jgi:pimeloyl-ACP methyl ester carboxylesterase
MRCLLLAALSVVASLAPAQEIVTLATRADATQSYLLVAPKEAPQAAAVLFPGGAGNIRLRTEDGEIKFGPNNFLVRTRTLFASREIAAAVVDAPSDQAGGMTDEFRTGDRHLADIRGVIADLRKRYPGKPVFLVGTSRGTLSAAYAARALGKDVAGTVLTSAVYTNSGKRPGPVLGGFNFGALGAPLLIVHHREDGCRVTPYSEALRLADKYPLISVTGGKPPESEPCEALSAHGFLGKEEETVEAIVNWMLKKPHRSEIN